MKEAAVQSADAEYDPNSQPSFLLDTLVAAHYLALQMKMLTQDESFRGSAATGFLAEALIEWARQVEDDLFEQRLPGQPVSQAQAPQPNVTSIMKFEKH
jgi:hypothetical protein